VLAVVFVCLRIVPVSGTFFTVPILMKNVNKHLSEKLRELRGERSLYQVGQELNFSRSLLSRYEKGEQTPEDTTLKRLAEYYAVSYEELKKPYFEDLYPKGSEARQVLEAWLKEQ
jgi:transcriptional regulator with XRE-family HTH domain